MTSVEGAVAVKTQEPNQYWEHVKSGDRVYFIGRTPDGEMVWQCEGDSVEIGNIDWDGWRHIPGCTGWDWEPDQAEEYPQYWTTIHGGSLAAFMKRTSQNECFTVLPSGESGPVLFWDTCFPEKRTRLTEQQALALLDKPAETWPKFYINRDRGCKWYVRAENHRNIPKVYLPDGSIVTSQANWDGIDDSLSRGVWLEVTEAEARARIAVPAEPTIEVQFLPVAPEMDWVVQDRVPARNHVDEWAWCKRGSSPGHFYSGFGGWSSTIMHGHVDGDEVLHLRCRRKDLPPVPAPVEETFPQWYILKDDEKRSWVPDWTVKRIGKETSIRYARDEGGELYATAEPWNGAAGCWDRCSEAEAIVRIGTSQFPAVPAEPRRVPVKLWVTYRLNDEGGDWPVRATQADQTCQNWKEIKFDGNGAFIEVES